MNENFITGLKIDSAKLTPESYVRHIPALRSIRHLDISNRLTFLVGENGSGKSTLLEGIAIAYGFNPEGGTRNFLFSTKDTHSDLAGAIRMERGIRRPQDEFFLRAESFYNVATEIDRYEQEGAGYFGFYGGKSLHHLSHGESFLALAQNRFKGNGLYLLDEPEAALSPQRQLSLLVILHDLLENGSQFIIATHSPILLGIPGGEILSLDGEGIAPVSYEETGCCQIMSLFINHREELLNHLLDQGGGSFPL